MKRSDFSMGRAVAGLVLLASLLTPLVTAGDAAAMTDSDFASALLASCNGRVDDAAKNIHLPGADRCMFFPKDIDPNHHNYGGPADPANFASPLPAPPPAAVAIPSRIAGSPTVNCSPVSAQFRLILSDSDSQSGMLGFQAGGGVGSGAVKFSVIMQYWHTWTKAATTTDMVVVNSPPWSRGQIMFAPEAYIDRGWMRMQYGSAVAGPDGVGHFYWYVPYTIVTPAPDVNTGAAGAYQITTSPLAPDTILTDCARNGGVTPQQVPLVNEGATQTDGAARCLNAIAPGTAGALPKPQLEPCGPSLDQHFLLLQVGTQTSTPNGVGAGPPVYLLASVAQRRCIAFTDDAYPYQLQPCDPGKAGQQFTANPVLPARTPASSTGNAFTLSNAQFPNECLRGASATVGAQFYPVGRCNEDELMQVWSTTPAYFPT